MKRNKEIQDLENLIAIAFGTPGNCGIKTIIVDHNFDRSIIKYISKALCYNIGIDIEAKIGVDICNRLCKLKTEDMVVEVENGLQLYRGNKDKYKGILEKWMS